MKKISLSLITLAFLFIISGFTIPKTLAFSKQSFASVTVLVRGLEDWQLKDQQPLDLPLLYHEQATQSGVPTSYMLRYDVLTDKKTSSEIAAMIASDKTQTLGGLLEVTPKLAKNASADYQNHGSFNSANHIFLSGYKREDRLKIIDTYMDLFFNRFGSYPAVVGVDSLDSFSFDYLVSRYSVVAAFITDETYQNNNLRQWGGYLAAPYLPSKTNILVPAQGAKSRINGTIFKWSPTNPLSVLSSSGEPDNIGAYALKTLNENTYINTRLDNDYQPRGVKITRQDMTNFINQLKKDQNQFDLKFESAIKLGELVKARHPETPSASFFKLGNIYWYQNPFYRLVLLSKDKQAEIVDFRVYNPQITGNYFHQRNIQPISYQEVPDIIDAVKYPTSPVTLDIDLENAQLSSEYWELVIKDQQKILRLQPNKIVFKKLTPPDLQTNQITTKTTKDSTQWLITKTLPFNELAGNRFLLPKIILTLLLIFLILKSATKNPPKAIFLGLVFGFFSLIPVIFSGQIYSFGLGLWGPNGHDAIFHLSVISSLKDSLLSLSHPQFSGSFLKNYHLGVDWIIAFISKFAGFNATHLFFRWLPVILMAVIVSESIKLLTSWKFSKLAIYLSLFLAFMTGSFGFVFSLLKTGSLFMGESLFWMNQSISIFLNPPFAFSIALLLIFLNLYTAKKGSTLTGTATVADSLGHRVEGRLNLNGSFFLLILIGGLLAQIKIYAFILLLLSLLILKEIRLMIGIGLVGLLLSLPTLGLQGSPFVFSPLWFPKSLIAAQDKLNLSRLAQAWQVYEVNGVFIKLFMVNLLALGIYFLGNLGIRVIGLYNILKAKVSLGVTGTTPSGIKSVTLAKLIIIIGLIIPLLFIQKSNPWNTIQFSYYSLFLLSFFTAQQLASWLTTLPCKVSHTLQAAIWIVLLSITLPTTIGTLKDYLTPYSASKISFTELQALETLKTTKKGIVISPLYQRKKSNRFPEPKPLYAYTSTAYISAFSGQPEYLSDLINLQITGFDYKQRAKNVQRLFRTQDAAWAKEFLVKEGIRYVYTTPIGKLNFPPVKAGLIPIFTSGEITIYQKKS